MSASHIRVLRHLSRSISIMAVLLAACSAERAEDHRATLQVWAHAGRAAEREVLEAQVARFNAGKGDHRAVLTFLPEGTYNGQVQAAALAGDLPAILEFDGPYLASLA
ncbi:MAG: hypothetical protein JSW10_11745, partial [Pseudomonadota bacterium]